MQFAQGGTCYAIGNVIIQGVNSHNSEIVTFGGEGVNANPYLYVVNNTIINQLGSGAFLTMSNSTYNSTTKKNNAFLQNNILQGSGSITGGTYASEVTQSGNWSTSNAYFLDPANHNYRLTSASTGAINKGIALGTGYGGISLVPTYQYVFPYANQARPTDSTIDVGAYEYTPNHAPVVDAGPAQSVVEGQAVQLHATASDFDCNPLTYAWTQPGGLNVVLTGIGSPDLAFTAPTISTLAQAGMAFTVTVGDGQGGLTSDSVNVRVYMAGDINRDDSVDVTDLLQFAAAFGTVTGDAKYDAASDVNSDGSVDVVDLMTLAENWGRMLN